MLSFKLVIKLLNFLGKLLILQFDLFGHSTVRCLLLKQLKLLIFIQLTLTVRIIDD
jgi:hypothetical protein